TLAVGAGGATFNFPQFLSRRTRHTISAPDWSPAVRSSALFLTLSGSGNLVLAGGALNNAGTITQVNASSFNTLFLANPHAVLNRSEERRVGKEGRPLWTTGADIEQTFNNSGRFVKSGSATA